MTATRVVGMLNITETKRKPTWREPEFYKKFITTGQLTQFGCLMTSSLYTLWLQPPNFPLFLVRMLVVYMISMMALFGHFFYNTYSSKQGKGGKSAKSE